MHSRLDIQFDVLRWNFSNLSSCLGLWLLLFLSTCTIVYYSFHFWAYKRLTFIQTDTTDTDKLQKKSKALVIFDWLWFSAYCCYFALFFYFPVSYILEGNYPIVTRIIILVEQVRFLMKSHAFVRENAPRAILYGQIHSQQSRKQNKTLASKFFVFLVNAEDIPASPSDHNMNPIPHTPCPEFSKFLYFLFAPTLIYRDSYPRTSTVRWNYVLSNLAQFATTTVFAYYLFYRFCLPVFRHFNSEHVTLKIFVLSILNCTLPGALVLFCGKNKMAAIRTQKSVFFFLVHSFLWFSSLLAQCIC